MSPFRQCAVERSALTSITLVLLHAESFRDTSMYSLPQSPRDARGSIFQSATPFSSPPLQCQLPGLTPENSQVLSRTLSPHKSSVLLLSQARSLFLNLNKETGILLLNIFSSLSVWVPSPFFASDFSREVSSQPSPLVERPSASHRPARTDFPSVVFFRSSSFFPLEFLKLLDVTLPLKVFSGSFPRASSPARHCVPLFPPWFVSPQLTSVARVKEYERYLKS